MGLEDTARGRENVDHGTRTAPGPSGGGDDIPFGIEPHSVNAPLGASMVPAKLVQNGVWSQRPILLDRVRPELSQLPGLGVALCDVQCLLVGRHQDPIGPGTVIGCTLKGPVTIRLRIRS